MQPQSQRTGRALQQALNIPGNLSEPFIIGGRVPTHPLPSRPAGGQVKGPHLGMLLYLIT